MPTSWMKSACVFCINVLKKRYWFCCPNDETSIVVLRVAPLAVMDNSWSPQNLKQGVKQLKEMYMTYECYVRWFMTLYMTASDSETASIKILSSQLF